MHGERVEVAHVAQRFLGKKEEGVNPGRRQQIASSERERERENKSVTET